MKKQTLPGFSAGASLYRKTPAFGEPIGNYSIFLATPGGAVYPAYGAEDCYASCRRVGLTRRFCEKSCS